MTVLHKFLNRNQITKSNPLPLVHTTESYYLKKILQTGQIEARPCNVFAGEKLSYFFVGRAAYKKELHQEAEYWELPTCIVKGFTTKGVKRIFPFDSGAFAAKRYPNSINMMDLNDFEVSADLEAPQKLIDRHVLRHLPKIFWTHSSPTGAIRGNVRHRCFGRRGTCVTWSNSKEKCSV